MKRCLAVAVALACVGVVACGDDADEAAVPAQRSIAFLRAVAGTAATEPAFTAELRAAGYVRGLNLTVIAGDANIAYPDPAAAEAAVREWRAQGVDLIVALSSGGAQIARRVAPDVNVLFLSNDPTATGLVKDERAPEGRLTGATFRVPADRTLGLARRVVPGLTKVGLVYPADDPAAVANRDAVTTAAGQLQMELVTEAFADASEITAAVGSVADRGAGALIISTSPIATRAIGVTGSVAGARRLPVIANTNLARFAVVSLYPDSEELGRQLGRQAARLLSGSSPQSVPVEDPRRFLVTINVAAAKTFGFDVSDEVLREANEVIR